MTELEQLLLEFAKPLGLSVDNEEMFRDYTNLFEQKYSVTLRNNDSLADNNKVVQLHSDEELMSKIECIALELADNFAEGNQYVAIEESDFFQKWTKKQFAKVFQTYRNTNSTAVKQKVDNLVDEVELRSKIEFLLDELETESEYDSYLKFCHTEITNKKDIINKLTKLFKTYQNSILRPVNDSDEQSKN